MRPGLRRLGIRLWLPAGLGVSLLALWVVGPVLAHPEIVSAIPAPGSIVPAGLSEIRLTFNEPVSPGSQITVYAAEFQVVAGVTSHTEGADLFGRLSSRLGEGTYTVQWAAVGSDGHPVEGTYQFAVSAAVGAGQGPTIIFISSLVLGALGVGVVGLLAHRGRRR